MTNERPSGAYPATQASITPTPLLHHALDVVAKAAESDPQLRACLQMGEAMFAAEMRQMAEHVSLLETIRRGRQPQPKPGGPYYFTTW